MRIGIDLGGTKIEAIAIDRDGSEMARIRVPTPAKSYDRIVCAIVDIVGSVEKKTGGKGSIGIGTPGAISPATGRMQNSNTVCLNNMPLDRDLEKALGRPIRMANDANCFALSEAVDGAGRDGEVVFGVIVGTGTGGGIVVNKKILTGPNGIAGEWGHNQLPWIEDEDKPLRTCYCGKQGCVETFLSGTGLTADHEIVTGRKLLGKDIAAGYAAGDKDCTATMRRYERRMAKALANLINILDPDVVVLGGGVSNMTNLYDHVPKLWQEFIFAAKATTRLVKNHHGDSSGVRGAAWLWPD